MRGFPKTFSGKLTMVALTGMAVVHMLSVLLLEGELPPLAIVMELTLLALAALITTGKGWIYYLAAVISSLLFLLTLIGSMPKLTNLNDPASLSAAGFLILALIAIISSIWSAVEVRRTR